MSIFKVKLRLSDRLWTKYLRMKQNFTCQVCGRPYTPDNCRNLGVSHFWGRASENTRFDEENTNCMCNIPCHRYFDTHKTEYRHWMLERLGQKRYDLLELRAHLYKKRDDTVDCIIIKQLLKEANGHE